MRKEQRARGEQRKREERRMKEERRAREERRIREEQRKREKRETREEQKKKEVLDAYKENPPAFEQRKGDQQRMKQDATKRVEKAVLRGCAFDEIAHMELYRLLREKLQAEYEKLEDEFFSQNWISFTYREQKGYWNPETQIAIPVYSSYRSHENDTQVFDLACAENVSQREAQILFNKNTLPNEIMNAIKATKITYSGTHYIGFCLNDSYGIENDRFAGWNDSDSLSIKMARIPADTFKLAVCFQEYDVVEDSKMKSALELLKGRQIKETEDKTKCISEQEVDKLCEILHLDRRAVAQEPAKYMSNITITPEMLEAYKESLLRCDTRRADLERYDAKCLEDVNGGIWELWSDGEPEAQKGEALVALPKPFVARNPAADIHEDGLIGIDFGTKSTIVSKQDGREKTTLLRVGIGQLAKAAEAYHYENPTIMEFRDLDKFAFDYKAKAGRPETSINDLRVSHAANTDLKSCTNSDEFYSYFYGIKQWCGDTTHNIKIIDQKGVTKVLPAFVKLEDDDFDPLEIYAYYLGLYINNMRNGIYLDYVLSFPVTYEKAVKQKILESFTAGLKKSLPESILNDQEIMSKFRVRQGVSEPAAYAITALQGYGFEPNEGENVLYAIFDFGGGTTDFDFGLWRQANDTRAESRYDYVIEHFGSEGDKYLGGENLLELLAFEIFKANALYLGRNTRKAGDAENAGFSFSKPAECEEFPGSEVFISDSQEAKRNTKQLMEALRPFWEGIVGVAEKDNSSKTGTKEYEGYLFRDDDTCKFPIDDGIIEVDLFDKEGRRKQKQQLYIQNQERNIDLKLTKILEDRIEQGVKHFFTSITFALRNDSAKESSVEGIQIFLAGNSSKSPILRKLFDKYIALENKEIKTGLPDGGCYHLFPPLGTQEAKEIQRARGVKVDDNDITAPTGKTGVAYGLITGRDGGTIKVISETKAGEQTKFRFNIGIARRGKFTTKLDRNQVDYGQWVEFIDAGVEDFEIYYTSLPSASKMSVDEQGVYKKRCRLSEVDENKNVYIRCVEDAPEDIEYCVADSVEAAQSAKAVRVHLEE